jgi:phage tail protein domain
MDANGTFFHLLLDRDDWGNCVDAQRRSLRQSWDDSKRGAAFNKSGTDWNEERAELTLQRRLFQFNNTPRSMRPELRERRGAARDRYGNWYWIDARGREILVNSSGAQAVSHFWSSTDLCAGHCAKKVSGDFQLPEPETDKVAFEMSGLAITAEHYLVVGVVKPAGLLIFDLYASSEPRQLLWPTEVNFAPYDMAAAPDGGVFILDRKHARYWALDRYFNVISPETVETTNDAQADDDFQSEEGSDVRHTPKNSGLLKGITDDDACPVGTGEAVAIEALPDGTVLILEGNPDAPTPPTERFSLIHRYRYREELGEPASTKVMLNRIEETDAGFSLVGYDFACVADDASADSISRLYVVERSGNQSYAFLLKIEDDKLVLEALADYLPMRLFGGKGLVVAGESAYYDFEQRWIPLVKQPRPRYVTEATLFTPLALEEEISPERAANRRGAFDGREPDCVWHRLMLDACIRPEARIEVWSRAANDEYQLALTEWQQEPSPYLRGNGSELPFASSEAQSKKGFGTWETLFQNARGRFLQLQLKLIGNGRATPRLRALRAYYPRFSYLNHYLPAVYREDEQSASFLDRFLANLEGFYTTVEDRIAAAQMLFDTWAAPQEALDWLASWFGVALDPAWDNHRRRLFITHAVEFFNRRGTLRGLKLALELALAPDVDEAIFADTSAACSNAGQSGIRIVEKYRTRTMPGVVFGDPTDYEGVPGGLKSTRWLAAEVSATDVASSSSTASGASFESLTTKPLYSKRRRLSRIAATQTSGQRTDAGAAAIAREREGWQTFLKSRYANIEAFNSAYASSGQPPPGAFTEIPLPADLPPQGAPLDDWLKWLAASSQTAGRERRLWEDFLARRYRMIAALNRAYLTRWPNFETVSLPDAMPTRNLAAQDWQSFAGVVLAMHRTAHRFSVLLPVPPANRDDTRALDERRALAERIINLEKPAHTRFEVKFYWAAFRLGEARLGTDTIVDRGRRAGLIQPMVLNRCYIAESYLASENPPDLPDRLITGRTRLGN